VTVSGPLSIPLHCVGTLDLLKQVKYLQPYMHTCIYNQLLQETGCMLCFQGKRYNLCFKSGVNLQRFCYQYYLFNDRYLLWLLYIWSRKWSCPNELAISTAVDQRTVSWTIVTLVTAMAVLTVMMLVFAVSQVLMVVFYFST